jgi:hypothetical protein
MIDKGTWVSVCAGDHQKGWEKPGVRLKKNKDSLKDFICFKINSLWIAIYLHIV